MSEKRETSEMKQRKLTRPRLLLALAITALVALVAPAAAGAEPADEFHIQEFSAQAQELLKPAPEEVEDATQAGVHPDLFVVKLAISRHPLGPLGYEGPDANPKDVSLELPPGFVGNAEATPKCKVLEVRVGTCPPDAMVGIHELTYFASGSVNSVANKVYNVVPPAGVAARFLMSVAGSQLVAFDMTLNSDGRYTLGSNINNIPQSLELLDSRLILFGVPALMNGAGPWKTNLFPGTGLGGRGGGPAIPLLTLPSTCGPQGTVKISTNTWQRQDTWYPASYTPPEELTGCDKLTFSPKVRMHPESSVAGAPSGYSFELEVPQNEAPNTLGTPPLKDTVVTLPEGVALSPTVAEGAVGCTDEEAALHSLAESSCPEASKIGSVEIRTPILAGPLKGSVYLGQPKSSDSQSGEMFRMFFAASGYGVTIKQEGRVVPDPVTGRLRTVFTESPQQPFSLLKLDFRGGPRAVLTNPGECGTYTTDANLTPWSGPAAEVSGTFAIDQGCGVAAGFTPGLEAGTANPVAGSYSPFTLRVTRPDGQQNISVIGASLPEGLLARLAGVPLCPDAQAVSGDCPAASQVGTTTVGAGAGSNPIYVPQPGREPTGVYLAGPYKGAPYSLVVKVPAQAGPFDLGTVAVRNALHIDPETTQVTTESDPLPQILQGVPVSYRDVRVNIDRPGFTVNPTSCTPTQVGSTIGGAGGAVAHPSSRFQVGDCGALAFGPKVALRLSGAPPRRGGNPALKAVVTPPEGQANIGRATVVLPETELLEQGHIKTVCTRVQFAADECPAGSVYGHAQAWTPLLDTPLEGPVYLRSNGGERKLPDLVADLNGSIHVVLVGYIDSVKRHGSPRIRTRFLSVPDAPVSRFVLEMQRGKKSLLANNTNLCKAKPRAEASLTGQNGKAHEAQPLVSVEGCGKKSKASK